MASALETAVTQVKMGIAAQKAQSLSNVASAKADLLSTQQVVDTARSAAAGAAAFASEIAAPSSKEEIRREGNVIYYSDGSVGYIGNNNRITPIVDNNQLRNVRAQEDARQADEAAGVVGGSLQDTVGTFLSTATDIAAGAAKIVGTGDQTLTSAIAKHNNIAESTGMVERGDAQAVSGIDAGKFRSILDKIGTKAEFSAEDKVFMDTPEYALIKTIQDKVDNEREKAASIDKFKEKFNTFVAPTAQGDDVAYAIGKQNAEDAGGTLEAISYQFENIGQMVKSGVASIPYTIANTIGGPVTQMAILAAFSRKKAGELTETFITEQGREPTEDELTRINLAGFLSAASEKFGDVLLVKGFSLGRFSKSVKAIADSTPSIMRKFIAKPLMGLAGEASSGMLTELADQYGVYGEVESGSKIAQAGIEEMVGVVGGVGGIAAGRLALGAVKSTTDSITAESRAERLRDTLATPETVANTPEGEAIQTQIDEINAAIEGNALTTTDGADTASVNVVALAAERVTLQAQLDAPAPGALSAEQRADAQYEYDTLPDRVKPEVQTAKQQEREAAAEAATKSQPPKKEEEKAAPKDTSEITPADLKTALDSISLEVADFDATMETITSLNSRQMNPEQKALLNAKKAELREVRNKVNPNDAPADTGKKKPFRNIDLEEEVTAEDEANAAKQIADSNYLKVIKKVQKLSAKLTKNKNANTGADVGADVRTGVDPRWTGFKTYLNAINEASTKAIGATSTAAISAARVATVSALEKLTTHSNNISGKSKALSNALAKAQSTGQAQYVRGNTAKGYNSDNNRVMAYSDATTEEGIAAAFDNRKESGAYIYRIDDTPQGQSLVGLVKNEAAYGKAVLEAANAHQETSFVKAPVQEKVDASKQAKQAEALNEQQAPTVREAATDTDLDALDNLGSTTNDSTNEVFDNETGSVNDSDSATEEGDSLGEAPPSQDSPSTDTVQEQSVDVPKKAKTSSISEIINDVSRTIDGVKFVFVSKGDSRLKGALARSGKTGVVMQKKITKEEVLSYIQGIRKGQTSAQKAVVTTYMQDERGVDLIKIINDMTDQQVREFIVYHEISHQKNDDTKGYHTDTAQTIAADKADTGNKYLSDSAIKIEARANMDALETMGLLPAAADTALDAEQAALEDDVLTSPNITDTNFLNEETDQTKLSANDTSGKQFEGKGIEAFIKITASRKGIFNIPSEVFNDSDALITALMSFDPVITKEIATATVARYMQLKDVYSELTKAPVQTAFGVDTLRIPLELLKVVNANDGKAVLPPQVIFAVSMGLDHWINQNYSSRPFATSREAADFMYGNMRATLDQYDQAIVPNLGLSHIDTTQEIGMYVQKLLGMSAVNTQAQPYMDALSASMGSLALQLVHKGNTVPNTTATSLNVREDNFNFANRGSRGQIRYALPEGSKPKEGVEYLTAAEVQEINDAGRNFVHGTSWLSIEFTQDGPLTTRSIKDIRTANTTSSILMDTFGAYTSDENNNGILNEPSKSVTRNIKGSLGKASDAMVSVMRKMQKVVWTPSDAMSPVVTMYKANPELMQKRMGVVEYEANFETNQRSEALNASNQDKIDSIERIIENYEGGFLDRVFFKYRLMNQHRMMMQGTVNPQNSHGDRYLLGPEGTTTYTKDNIHLFKYAVMFSFGYSVDKKVDVSISETFDNYLTDPNIRRAAELIGQKNINTVALSEAIETITTGEYADTLGSTDLSLFNGLIALSKYMAVDTSKENFLFESDVVLEIDGVSNGFSINVMQFPMFGEGREGELALEKHLNQVAVYIGKEQIHLEDGIFNPQSSVSLAQEGDPAIGAYEELMAHISAGMSLEKALEYYSESMDVAEIKEFAATYKARNTAMGQLMPLLGEVTRNLVKYPFMIFMYGGGVPSIARGVASQGIDQLYTQIGVLRKQVVTGVPEATANIDAFLGLLETLGVASGDRAKLNTALTSKGIGSTERFQAFSFNDNNLSFLISEIIKPRFDYGLKTMLGNTSVVRKSVIQAGELMHAIFLQRFNIAKAQYLEDNDRTDDFLSDKELEQIALSDEVIDWLPKFIGPLTDELKGEFIDITKRSSKGPDSKGLTVSTVLRSHDLKNTTGQRTVSTETKQKNFVSPGVSALIRTIINIDAAMLATAMSEVPNLLPLYDAAMGRPELLKEFATTYNEAFEKFGFETNIAAQFNQRVNDLQQRAQEYDDANGTNITAYANSWVLDNLYENQFNDEKSTFDQVKDDLAESSNKVTKKKNSLEKTRDTLGMTFNQMFMRDLTSENPTSGTSVDEKRAGIQASAEIQRGNALFDNITLPFAVKQILSRLIRSSDVSTVGNKLQTFDPLYVSKYIDLMIANENGNKSTPITDLVLALGKQFGTPTDNYMDEGAIALQNLITGENRTYAIEAGLQQTTKVNATIRAEFAKQLQTDVSFIKIDALADQEIANVMADYIKVDDNINKSLEGQRKENPATILETAIDSTNVRQLFDRFKNASKKYYDSDTSMEAHAASMEQVLEAITKGVDHVNNLNLKVEEINGITQGEFNQAENTVNVAASRQLPGGRNAHSPQEVYLHEVLHALTVQAIADNKSGLAEQIHTIRNSVRKAIDAQGGYRIFLTDTLANSSPNEVKFAKDQYRYLFGAAARNVPEEFLAYALTNPAMIKALQNHDRRRPDRGDGLIATLQSMLDLVIDYFIRAINRRRTNPNGHAEMIAIAQQLIDMNSKHADIATKAEMKAVESLDKADKKVVAFVIDKAQRMVRAGRNSPLGQIPGAVIGGGALLLSENVAIQNAKLQIYSNLQGVAGSLVSELGDGALTKPLVKMLLHAQSKIGKLYQQVEIDAVRRAEESWKSTKEADVGIRTRQAMTRVLYRTDLSSLLSRNFSMKQIQQLLANPDNAKTYIKTLTKEMGLAGSSDAIRYAKDLGHHMATNNRTLSNGHFNVHTIAAKFLTTEQNTPDNIKRLDAIASLAALGEQDSADLKMVSKLMAQEIEADPAENAFQFILESHRAYVAASLNGLFDNNPTQMVKGYTVERIDNLTDVQTGLGDPATIRRMKLAGYGEHYNMTNIPGVPQAHTTMYVSRYMPEIRHISGILSTTGLHHKGTLISEIIAKDPQFQKADGTPDMKKIANKLRAIRKQEDQHAKNKTKHNNHNLNPIYDENGNISDYRVIMDLENQEKMFQPDIEFQNVFAHMRSAYISKKNTIIADKETVDLLVDEWVRMEPTGKYKFINILDTESPYHERYKKLPDEVRQYMSQYVVGGKFLVREEIINKVFGYPAIDLSNIPGVQSEIMAPVRLILRNLHYALRKFMTFGMERIVMASLTVIVHNIRSNLFQLGLFAKIPPTYASAKMKEGYVAFARYDADNQSLRDARQDWQIAEAANNTAGMAKIQKIIDALSEQIEENPIHRISELGINTLILEGVNTASKEGFMQRAHKMLQADKVTKYSKHMPTTVGTIAKNMVLTRDSEIYKTHKKAVQLTDFLGRYALISYNTEVLGQDFDTVFHEAVDAFVLFDENMHPVFELINSMGFTAFLSYWLRVSRPVRRYMQRSPFTVATSVATEAITGIDTTAMLGGSILGGKFLPNNFYMDDLADAATTLYGPANIGTVIEEVSSLIPGD